MHVHTFNFTEFEGGIRELLERTVDALVHVRDTDGASALVVSVFLPDAQCHLLFELDDAAPGYCDLTVVEQNPEDAVVLQELPAKKYDEALGYVRHIVETFLERRSVSNVLVSTDGRRVQDVRSKLGRKRAPVEK
jgi:hypothetical protein